MDSVGLPYPGIYIPANVSRNNELSYIFMQQTNYKQNYIPMNQQNFDNPPTLTPTKNNDSTVCHQKVLKQYHI